MPTIYIIAGPNGVGKTTFANRYLPDEAKQLEFVNADLIARGLSPFNPDVVAMEMILPSRASWLLRKRAALWRGIRSGSKKV